MRSHPRNSPQAAGRLVALLMLADGHVGRAELDALHRLGAERVLGLPPGDLERLVVELCEDLLPSLDSGDAVLDAVDEATLAALFAEVDDPRLQREVMRLAIAAAGADQMVAEPEAYVIGAAGWHWRLYDGRARRSARPG